MSSYFIFKGIKSSDMGVYVERLPAIIKPPKRYEMIEIDGSDYTEVEELGYQAYEKTIPIGFRNSNRDKIHNWLQGEGELIMSDEPDKYYQARVLEQISYDKDLSFRKSRIIFTVQPHKYKVNEYETTELTVTNEGNVSSLPRITVYGTGVISLLINGIKACEINITDYITLDSQLEEAYKDTLDNLQNRSMTGDFPKLEPGPNTIAYIGDVTTIITLPRSRWI